MEIVLAGLVAAAVAVGVVLAMQRVRGPAPAAAEAARRGGAGSAGSAEDPSPATNPSREEPEGELEVRRAELARLEERLRAKEASLDGRLAELESRERSIQEREHGLDQRASELDGDHDRQLRELERVAGLSAGQARRLLMRELEAELRHESARLIRQVEEETKHDAERRARSILSTVMQRVAGGHASETTISTVELRSDELKGRIIGREGRNIRTLENLTGIDFIIDDTPGAVLLSGFDGVRREIARLTLEKLLSDGRIHPARIEEAYTQARSALE